MKELGERYLEFFTAETGTLSLGLYVLSAGDTDPQQPHTEDEIYYVVSGSARLQVGDEDREVKAGNGHIRGDGRAASVSLDNGDADAAGGVRAAETVAG